MIVVAAERTDEEHEGVVPSRGRAERRDYRKLFAQLRKS
jgi:hypothetical protein